jgi:hypothetical protein
LDHRRARELKAPGDESEQNNALSAFSALALFNTAPLAAPPATAQSGK